MSGRKLSKPIHVLATVWFILCVAYILVLALRQAGFHWWVIFSLAGHSGVVALLLVSLYLFAIFRGLGRSRGIEIEHPLTTANSYMAFYVAVPLLGGLAGSLGMIGEYRVSQFLLGVALGTLGTTFFVWVIIDPVLGLLEMSLPASRKHRAERLARAKALRKKKQTDRERLLTELLAKEESDRRRWQVVLKPHAEKLAGLLNVGSTDFKQAEREAVAIGVKAWQIGGLRCMRQLHDMATARFKRTNQNRKIVDYLPVWWDGIGNWRPVSFEKMINSQS